MESGTFCLYVDLNLRVLIKNIKTLRINLETLILVCEVYLFNFKQISLIYICPIHNCTGLVLE